MKLVLRLIKEAKKYTILYAVGIISTILVTLLNLVGPKILSEMTRALQAGITAELLSRIVVLTLILVAVYLLRVLFRYLSHYMSHKAAWPIVEELRVRVYHKIQTLSMNFFHDKQTGDLMSRVVNDTGTFEQLYAHIIPESLTNIFTLLGVFIVLLTINVKLALFTCVPIPFILFFGVVYAKKVRPSFRIAQKELANLNSKLQDNFSGINEVQAFNQEEFERENVSKHAGNFTAAQLHAVNWSAIFSPTVEFFSSLGSVIVVGFGGLLAIRGQISVPDIVAFMLYLSLFYAPVTGLAKLVENIQIALAGAERVVAILDTPNDIEDAPGAVDIGTVDGDIEFNSVSFAYEPNNPVLKNISFSCRKGQMVALVGPTGVGKTTMTQLIARFYDPTNGTISIDGKDIRKVTIESLRRNLAPVQQDTFLFNGTLIDNIRYAAPNATMNEIIEAAKAACIHESIMEMPDKYETRVGERGMRLSGGQKQRVAIARAILRKAPIIILDEATASVDMETEKDIQSAISDLLGKRTIIAIAHRLSTIENADLIIVLEDGEIAQRGTHEELISQRGLYSRLYESANKRGDIRYGSSI